MPTCYLVIGTPRSGTSCVAGILHHLGVHMGDDLGGVDRDWNAKGFYEDGEFGSLYTDLIYPRDRGPGSLENHAPPFPGPALVGELRGRQRTLISNRVARRADWGVKSARLCYVLKEFIEDCHDPVKVVRCVRPLEVAAASWQARAGVSLQTARTTMANASEAIDLALKGCGVEPMVVFFERLLSESAQVVKELATLTGHPVTTAALVFPDPSLKRF
jgi:hypothetical protein